MQNKNSEERRPDDKRKKRGESMRQRKKRMFLLLMLLLTIGSVAAAQTSSADENSAATSDVTARPEEKQERIATDRPSGTETDAVPEKNGPEAETESETPGKTEAGERTTVLTVVAITGNELTYYEEETEPEEETETEAKTETKAKTEAEAKTEAKTETKAKTETEAKTETMTETETNTEAGGETEDAPPGARQSSDMPDVPQLPEGAAPDFLQKGDTPSGNAPSQPPISEGAPTDLIQNAAGITTKTVCLPVPVVVHTDDSDRTFSILEAGDQLQATIITDEAGNETITELWLLGTSEES